MLTKPGIDQSAHTRRMPTRLSIAAVWLLAAVVVLSGCGDDNRADTADPDPAGVIEDYRIAYNGGDIDAVMALFSEESVVAGHPFAPESAGLVAIRDLQLEDMGVAAPADAYEFSDVEVAGDTVTWNHVWTADDGTDWCGEGNSAVTADSQILTWTFAPARQPCA